MKRLAFITSAILVMAMAASCSLLKKPAPVVTAPVQETERIVTYDITFDTGKATLTAEADTEIMRIRDLMVKYPELRYEVQGHCDNTGSDAINDRLSQQRAEAIVARLVELGVSYDRLTPVGKGSKEPIADNKTEEGRARNRRVVFVRK